MKHTLRKNILSTAIAGSLMLTSGVIVAGTTTPTITIETLAALSFTEDFGVDFGDQLTGADGTTCSMTVSEVSAAQTGTDVVADINITFTGTGCPTAPAAIGTAHNGTVKPQAGVYTIDAAEFQVITISIVAAAGTGWTYEPIGYALTSDSIIDHSAPQVLDSSTPAVVTSGDTAGEGVQIILGGDIIVDVGTTLVAATSDSATYTITAIY